MFPNILILDKLSTVKNFITIVVLFFSFSLLAQSYFCTEEKVTGFNVKKNHEIIELYGGRKVLRYIKACHAQLLV